MDTRPIIAEQLHRIAAEYLSGVHKFNDERAGRLVLAAHTAGHLIEVEIDNPNEHPQYVFKAICRKHTDISPNGLPDLWPDGLTTKDEKDHARHCAAVCEWLASMLESRQTSDEEPQAEEILSEREQDAYDFIASSREPVTGDQIAAHLGVSASVVTSHLVPALKEKRGLLNKKSRGYYLP